MLYQVKVAYLKDGANYVNERGEVNKDKSRVLMTPDCAQHYIDEAIDRGQHLTYEEQTLQVSEEESLFYELGGYEVTPVPLTDPASINHRWQEFLNKISREEAHVLFVSLLALVKDVHVDQNLLETEWDVADQIFELLKDKLDAEIEVELKSDVEAATQGKETYLIPFTQEMDDEVNALVEGVSIDEDLIQPATLETPAS